MINYRRYRAYPYEDGARGPTAIDCWGLVREVRHDMGYPWLPAFSECRRTDPRGFTRAYEQQASLMVPAAAEEGSIATAFSGRLCVHVGIVVAIDSRLMVLDINPGRGVGVESLPDFEARYAEVKYYRDPNLSESVL